MTILALVAASVLFLLVYAATQWLALTLREWVRDRREECLVLQENLEHLRTPLEREARDADRQDAYTTVWAWVYASLTCMVLEAVRAYLGWGLPQWVIGGLAVLVGLYVWDIGKHPRDFKSPL